MVEVSTKELREAVAHIQQARMDELQADMVGAEVPQSPQQGITVVQHYHGVSWLLLGLLTGIALVVGVFLGSTLH